MLKQLPTTTLNILACLYYGSYSVGEYLPITWSGIKLFDIAARETEALEVSTTKLYTKVYYQYIKILTVCLSVRV